MALTKEVTFQDGKWGVATDPYTGTINVPAGTNALYVMVVTNQAQNVSGITFDGVSMTLDKDYSAASTKSWVYKLANPSTGSKTLSVDWSANCSYFNVVAMGVSGANAAALEGAAMVNYYDNNNANAFNGSITTQYDNSWVVDFLAIGGDGGTLSASNGQTLQVEYLNGFRCVIGTQLKATAGAVTSNYTLAITQYSYSRTTIELRAGTAVSFIPLIIMS